MPKRAHPGSSQEQQHLSQEQQHPFQEQKHPNRKLKCNGDDTLYRVFSAVGQLGLLFMPSINALSRTRRVLSALMHPSVLPHTLYFEGCELSQTFIRRANTCLALGKRVRRVGRPHRLLQISGMDLGSLRCVVSLRNYPIISDEAFASLSGMHPLHAVDATSPNTHSRVTDEGVKALFLTCKQLVALDLYNSPNVTKEGLEGPRGSLRAIDLSLCTGVTALPATSWPQLTHLSLMYCTGIDDWTFLTNFKCLQYLNAGFTSIDIHCVSSLNMLHVLHLNSCHRVDDKALSSLKAVALQQLNTLNLNNTPITNTGVASLATLQLPSLSTLLLADCAELDDACLDSLKQLSQTSPLKTLNLRFCDGVTQSAIDSYDVEVIY